MTAFDFIARLIVIEKREAIIWNSHSQLTVNAETSSPHSLPDPESLNVPIDDKKAISSEGEVIRSSTNELDDQVLPRAHERLSQWRVVVLMVKSPRAMASLGNIFIFAYVFPFH